jgi:hypothetical protein
MAKNARVIHKAPETYASCSLTALMSNIPTPENHLKRIQNLLTVLPKEIEAYRKLTKSGPGPVAQLLADFTTNPLIKSLLDAPQTLL